MDMCMETCVCMCVRDVGRGREMKRLCVIEIRLIAKFLGVSAGHSPAQLPRRESILDTVPSPVWLLLFPFPLSVGLHTVLELSRWSRSIILLCKFKSMQMWTLLSNCARHKERGPQCEPRHKEPCRGI